MGWLDRLTSRRTPNILRPTVTNAGPAWADWWEEITSDVHQASPAKLYRTQPHLYTVVSFLARNVAQLGLHVFERTGETDRRRDRESAIAKVLQRPNESMTTYELIYALVGDLALYDRAYWMVVPSSEAPSGWTIRRLPPTWVAIEDSTPFTVKTYSVSRGEDVVTVPAEQILDFTGYSPSNPLRGSSAIEALRDTLREQVESALYRKQTWQRGGRVSTVLKRPENTPWSDAAREAFRQDWYAKYTGNGSHAGGTPILEDGMSLERIDFNAKEQQFVEAAKLSLVTVASAFHINPTMIGQNDGANYSNVREFRRMLYGDTLGPLLAQIEARINAFLLPMLGVDSTKHYVEFNIQEKLEGNFEEQTAAMVRAVGGPWMLRSEARARMNLPEIEGADELIVPMNVTEGGQANPADSGSQNEVPGSAETEKALEVLAHQERVIRGRVGAKRADWWDGDRWARELGAAMPEAVAADVNALVKSGVESGRDLDDIYHDARARLTDDQPEEGA